MSSVLHTERLILRMLRESDLNAYAEMLADVEVMRYIGSGKALDRSEAWRNMAGVLGHWQLRSYGLWAVEERQSGELIGRIGFWNPEGWPGFEVGWMLRRRSWGQGFATEGARAAMHIAFEELNEPRVISLIQPGNLPSIRVAERIGEKLQSETMVLDKAALIYGISKQDWLLAKNAS